MTVLSRGGRNWKFLLALAVLLVLFLFPLVHGLISGVGRPDAAPATPDARPADVDILTVPGTGPAAGFDAWERLLADVLERMRQRGELRADAEPAALATGLLASIEGGMVLSQTRKDIASLRIAVEAGLGQVRAHLS